MIDASQLPAQASIRKWGQLLGVSAFAMRKRRARGELPGTHNPLTNSVIVTREVVLDAFRKHPGFYRLINENGDAKPTRRKSKPQPSTTSS